MLLTSLVALRWSSIADQPPVGYSKDEILQSVILAGDGGGMGGETAKLLNEHSQILSDRLTILFMGDNIYPAGLPPEDDKSYADALAKLNLQINTVKSSGAKVVFIPGNHDWEDPNIDTPDGWQRVIRQQKVVEGALGDGSFLPKNGCPGPVAVSLPPAFTLIALDSEWWFYKHKKPSDSSSGCSANTESEVVDQLAKLISENPKDKKIILTMHHPLLSYGIHRYNDGDQDFLAPQYVNYQKKIADTLFNHPVDLCSAGHDHSLQILGSFTGCKNTIVSGALTNTSRVKKSGMTRFSSSRLGFVRLDRFKNGKTRATALSPEGIKTYSSPEIFRLWLN